MSLVTEVSYQEMSEANHFGKMPIKQTGSNLAMRKNYFEVMFDINTNFPISFLFQLHILVHDVNIFCLPHLQLICGLSNLTFHKQVKN